MPNQRQKSVRTVIAETVMFVGMIAVVGHMAVNFWERFMIQSQLTQMKTSLYSLKDAVHNIGMAYDSLYTELQHIASVTEKESSANKNLMKTKKPPKGSPFPLQMYKYPKEIQVRAMTQPKRHYDVGTTFEKSVRDFIQGCRIDARNATTTTLTRYLPKSTGVNAIASFADVPSRKQFCCSCLHNCFDNEDEESFQHYWDFHY